MNTKAFEKFSATTSCKMLWVPSIYRLIIKSILKLFSKNCSYINPKKTSEMLQELIKDYYIKTICLIMYNTNMAYLYG